MYVYPDGATPLSPEEMDGLIPDHLTTRAQLNEWEHVNIQQAEAWAFATRRRDVLSIGFLLMLHRKMFDETWSWAGQIRRTDKNIGVPKEQVREELRKLCDDVSYWLELDTYGVREIAARFHHRLVSVHPFANGNGRHARLAADILLVTQGERRFSWSGRLLDTAGEARRRYIDALRRADRGEMAPLFGYLLVETITPPS
jgi:Fic-DOC domain mobile mystery protein B